MTSGCYQDYYNGLNTNYYQMITNFYKYKYGPQLMDNPTCVNETLAKDWLIDMNEYHTHPNPNNDEDDDDDHDEPGPGPGPGPHGKDDDEDSDDYSSSLSVAMMTLVLALFAGN
jgi:hypothetical protein